MKTERAGGGETRTFGPGSAIFIGPGENHTFHNDSAEAMEFVCMIPAGAAKPHEHD